MVDPPTTFEFITIYNFLIHLIVSTPIHKEVTVFLIILLHRLFHPRVSCEYFFFVFRLRNRNKRAYRENFNVKRKKRRKLTRQEMRPSTNERYIYFTFNNLIHVKQLAQSGSNNKNKFSSFLN